jgi:hypothetical protein
MSTKNQYKTIPAAEAKDSGYKPLTYPYMPKEYHMMKRVMDDMERGDIDYALVNENEKFPEDICVYRKD